MAVRAASRWLWVASLAVLGCDRPRGEAKEDAGPSPNASILPAPLASPPPEAPAEPSVSATPASTVGVAFDPSAGRMVLPDASAPLVPEPLRADQALPADTLTPKETAGVFLSGEWRWVDAPTPPRAPEVSADGLSAARRLTALKWVLHVTESGRLRVVFDSRAFPIPLGSELRARADRFGHVLVFSNGIEYRPVPPGALRSLFGDRRLDVLPLVSGEAAQKGAAPARLGHALRRVQVTSKMGTVTLDVAKMPEAGLGGALLCRTFVELIAVDPAISVCARDELPLRAQLTWPKGGSIVFEAHEMARRTDFPLGDVLCPPASTSFAGTTMPPQASGIFLTRDEAAGFRTRPVDVGPIADDAPGEGLLARNGTDALQYLLLDGVPLAWVLPGTEQYVIGPPKGRYVVQWRSFLSETVEPPKTLDLPARVSVGEAPDGGAPPAGSARGN